jgi:methyltransferase (TIGR00027 family)
MKNNQKSSLVPTLRLAYLRAAEFYQPEHERLFHDPFSRRLLPGLWKFFLLPGLRQAMIAMTDKVGPGVMGSVYCRTRYIDDALQSALENGASQLAILGAGFDVHAYRTNRIDEISVFEVDLPEIQHYKQDRIKKVLGETPSHVNFVPVDFEKQETEKELTAAGFRKDLMTFFIWEGVTQYLTAEAVDRTFEFFVKNGSAGSEVVFTYILQTVIDGTNRSVQNQKIISVAEKNGTPWLFGISPSDLRNYLGQKGLELLDEAGARDFRERYLDPVGRQMNILECERVALAKIKSAK